MYLYKALNRCRVFLTAYSYGLIYGLIHGLIYGLLEIPYGLIHFSN